MTLSVLVVGLSLAYVPYIFQTRDGGLPVPSVRLAGLALAIVGLVLVADGLLSLPTRLAATARASIPVLLIGVVGFIGSNAVIVHQFVAIGIVTLTLVLGPRLQARGLNPFLLSAILLSASATVGFLFYRPEVIPAYSIPYAPILIAAELLLVTGMLVFVVLGKMPRHLLLPTHLLAALVWTSSGLVMLSAGFILAGESALVLALALLLAPIVPPISRDRSLAEALVLGMVLAGLIPLVAVCSLGTMAWQISEEHRTESLHELFAFQGTRNVGQFVEHGTDMVDGLRWRDDMVDSVSRWDEQRIVRILAATLQATDDINGLIVLDPTNRVRARFGVPGLQLGDPFPDTALVAAALASQRPLALLGPPLTSSDLPSVALTVALRRPDGSPGGLIIGRLPATGLADATGAQRLGDTGVVALIDRRSGRVLAHPDRSLIGKALTELPEGNGLRALAYADDLTAATTSRSGPWLITRRGVSRVPWEVVAVQDVREALEPVNRLGAQALTATLFFAMLLGGIGMIVGRRLVRPVSALEMLAFQDPLTGLASRRFFVAWLMQAVELARRYEQPLALIFLDLDNFKLVNDDHGHLVGDQVLQEVAARIRHGLRASDMVVRYGGEEIVAALPHTSKEAAMVVADGLRRAVASSPVAWGPNGTPIMITVSAGVAAVPDDAADAQSLLETTDAALYRAKALGRDRVVPA